MRILHDVNLAEKTTFRVGGIAHNFYIPESEDEICNSVRNLMGKEYYIISGGSNLLINDQRVFEDVIFCGEFDRGLNFLGNGKFFIGASNRIQKVISFVNENGYGGLEELIGLPAMFGGIIYMNAGIGGRDKEKFNISDFILRVKCINRNTTDVLWLEKGECDFSYRHSIFKNNEYVILGAEIQLAPQSIETSRKRITARREHCKNNQEWGKGCFGSCFSQRSRRLLNLMNRMPKLYRGGVYQSRLNSNWLVNDGNGSFNDTMRIINRAIRLHKLFHVDIEPEVIIWK